MVRPRISQNQFKIGLNINKSLQIIQVINHTSKWKLFSFKEFYRVFWDATKSKQQLWGQEITTILFSKKMVLWML